MTRAPRKPTLSESALQRQIVDYVAKAVPAARVFAIPNAVPRTRGGRASNAIAGLTRGVPDLALVCLGGSTYWVEVKAGSGKISPEQKAIHAWMEVSGVPCAVVRSIEEFKAALAGWRIPTREAA